MNNTLLAWRSSFLSPVKFTIWYIYLQMTQETFSFNSWLRDISDRQNDNVAKLMSEPFEAGRKDKKLRRVKFKTFEAVFYSVGWLRRKKDQGARRKFWKEPLGGTKILFCERGLKNFFTPEEVTVPKQQTIRLVTVFGSMPWKVLSEAPAVELLKILTTLRGAETVFCMLQGTTSPPGFLFQLCSQLILAFGII